MRKIFFLLMLLIPITFLKCYAQELNADSLLIVLKKEIAGKSRYDLKKESSIKQLKAKLQTVSKADYTSRFRLYSEIFQMYKSYKFDSAFVYANHMITISQEFKDKEKLIESKILLGSTLLNSGFYKEAFDIIRELDVKQMPTQLRSDYLILRSRLYAGIAEYNNDGYFTNLYYKQSKTDFDNAEVAVPANAFEQTISKAFLPPQNRDKKLTPYYYYRYIIDHNLGEHKIAMASTRLSYAYTGETRIFFLALAAINDIRSATKETLAIYLLGQELYKMEKTDHAFLLMQEAAENAKFYGARSREVQIESILPLIFNKLVAEKQHKMDKILISALLFLLVALLLFFLLIVYRRQLKRIKSNEQTITEQNVKLKSVNEKLWESARIKEELIGLFIKSCSSYIEMIEGIKWKLLKIAKSGKLADLNAFIETLNIDAEKDRLYETLDIAFLRMYPNFITSFNTLLSQKDQIWPKDKKTLSATLRIFALMRLGIDELKVVAKILGYSESTIYTYKFRIKSKALIPGHEFDRRIMEIKFHENVE